MKLFRSTLFLKVALVLVGTPILALALFGLYWLIRNPANPDYAYILYPIVTGLYLSVIPFYFAFGQAYKLLNYIDENQAFSEWSVKALKKIKYSAITFCSFYVIILPFVILLAESDDAPGLVIMGMVPIFASIIIAVFAAVLQKLLKEAIDIKSENELIV